MYNVSVKLKTKKRLKMFKKCVFENIFSDIHLRKVNANHFVAQTHPQDCAKYIQQFTEELS